MSWVPIREMERISPLSDRAMSCFAHGLSHLFLELGREEGLRTGARILDCLSEADLDQVVGEARGPHQSHDDLRIEGVDQLAGR